MKEFKLQLDGNTVKVYAEKIAGKLWYHLNGETRCYEPESKYGSGQSAKANASPGVIVAPMPGKIIKVNCSVGEKVSVGDHLVTMEAMKMEYSLESDIDGQVESVNFRTGDQVNLGQKIVVVTGREDGNS